jgi:hypothetical protein
VGHSSCGTLRWCRRVASPHRWPWAWSRWPGWSAAGPTRVWRPTSARSR